MNRIKFSISRKNILSVKFLVWGFIIMIDHEFFSDEASSGHARVDSGWFMIIFLYNISQKSSQNCLNNKV